jgi:hypothetical protein
MSRRREELVAGQPNIIVLENYVGSDGVTIRIDIQSLVRLNELEAIVRNMASGKFKKIGLSGLKETHWVAPLQEIVLTLSERNLGFKNIKNEDRGQKLICRWTEEPEGWLEAAEKIAFMAASDKPCHQYFRGWQADSVTIELGFLE